MNTIKECFDTILHGNKEKSRLAARLLLTGGAVPAKNSRHGSFLLQLVKFWSIQHKGCKPACRQAGLWPEGSRSPQGHTRLHAGLRRAGSGHKRRQKA